MRQITLAATVCVLLVPILLAEWIGSETAQLFASDAGPSDEFGRATAVSGTTIVVGAPGDSHAAGSNAGSAYVFETGSGGTGAWNQVIKLVSSDAEKDDEFGTSVAASGATIVVGAHLEDSLGISSGAAYVFERDLGGPGSWGESEKLVASDGSAGDSFGQVAIAGDTIVVGAEFDTHSGFTNAGSAYVFERDPGSGAWIEVAKLTAGDPGADDSFGNSVAIHDDTIVVGARMDDDGGSSSGSAYVFERDASGVGAWGQVTKLTASDAEAFDEFGAAVAVREDTLLVSAMNDRHGELEGAGSAYVFVRGPGGWSEVAKLVPEDVAARDHFGTSVALDGGLAVVGSVTDDHEAGFNVGSAYLFVRDWGGPGSWDEATKLIPSAGASQDWFGFSAGLSMGTAILGAPFDDTAAGTQSGSATVFWISFSSEAYCTAGTSASGCQATLSASGVPSATAPSGFTLSTAMVEGDKDGLFYFGTSGRQANPWGNGASYQCVVPPVTRGGLLTGIGTSGACNGSFTQDLNALWCPTCPKAGKNPGSGALVQAQLWYRDPQGTSNQTTSLSDAIEFAVSP